MRLVIDVKIIRKDGDLETTKTFHDCPQYQGLKPGDIVEVEDASGQLIDYYVTNTRWDFSHFGDTIVVTIEPGNPPPKVEMIYVGSGQYAWIRY